MYKSVGKICSTWVKAGILLCTNVSLINKGKLTLKLTTELFTDKRGLYTGNFFALR